MKAASRGPGSTKADVLVLLACLNGWTTRGKIVAYLCRRHPRLNPNSHVVKEALRDLENIGFVQAKQMHGAPGRVYRLEKDSVVAEALIRSVEPFGLSAAIIRASPYGQELVTPSGPLQDRTLYRGKHCPPFDLGRKYPDPVDIADYLASDQKIATEIGDMFEVMRDISQDYQRKLEAEAKAEVARIRDERPQDPVTGTGRRKR